MNYETALGLCLQYHHNQKRHNNVTPYSIHPIMVSRSFTDEPVQIVAVLHDIIEDTKMTLAKLREYGFSEYIIDAIDAITKRKGETGIDVCCKVL